jgi:hypothetical protein
MITSRRLTATLTRTLEVKAGQAMTTDPNAADAPLVDPTHQPSNVSVVTELTDLTDLLDDGRDILGRSRGWVVDGRSPTGRRRLLVPAAAVIVVLALLGGGAVGLRGGSNDKQVGTVVVGDAPDGWLVPTWVPEGMELWGVEWSGSSDQLQTSEPGTIPQLFGNPDGGRAIYITSFRYEVPLDTADQVTVRGQDGQAGPGWDAEETDMGDAITWDERGATVTALYKGMSQDEAIAALASLEWRSDDPADGFAPPADGSLPLSAEVSSRQPVGRDVTLVYSEGVPAAGTDEGRLGLWIHASTGGAVSAGYLEGWYEQGPEAGGGERPVSRYDQDWHELTVLWPDGRSIDISPAGVPQSELPSREMLERIADSLAVSAEADLAALRDTSEANIEALPVLASTETSIGTVQVHGESGFLQMCLGRPSEQGPSCMTDTLGGRSFDDGTAIATAEWTVDGTWYVAVATKGDEPQVVGGRNRSGSPDAGELPAETTTIGEWTLRLVQPAPDIELVCTSSASAMSCSHQRPG